MSVYLGGFANGIRVYRNGSKIGDTESSTLNLVFNAQAGDEITVNGYSAAYWGSQTMTVTRCNVTTRTRHVGAIVGYSDLSVESIATRNERSYRSFPFSMTAPSAFGTQPLLSRRSGTEVTTALATLPGTWVGVSAGQVSIDGGTRTITRVRRVGTSIEFDTTTGPLVVDAFRDGSTVGAYGALATTAITLVSQIGALLTKHLLPKTASLYDLGSLSKPYREVHAASVHATTGVDTGQGVNRLFPMDQPLTSADSPAFAGVTTVAGPNRPVDSSAASMPSVGVGGFTYGKYLNTTTRNSSVTLPPGGTYVGVFEVFKYQSGDYYQTRFEMFRASGGSNLAMGGNLAAQSYIHAIAFRIA